jgi:preprotein translocase subunit Sec61beta
MEQYLNNNVETMQGVKAKMSSKKKKPSGPMSAAGLVSYYEDLESVVKITPTQVFIITVAFATLIIALRVILG